MLKLEGTSAQALSLAVSPTCERPVPCEIYHLHWKWRSPYHAFSSLNLLSHSPASVLVQHAALLN